MDNVTMFNAMAQIDDRLIERCLCSRNARPTARKKAMTAVACVAAIAVVCLSAIMIIRISQKLDHKTSLTDQALKIGFDYDENEKSAVRIAVMTEKSKIRVGEDLSVSVYSICGSEKDDSSSASAKIRMSYSRIDPNDMIKTVKIIDDATEDGYTWTGSFSQIKSERITVPAAVFTKAEKPETSETDGVIVLTLEVNKKYSDGSENMMKDSAALYYKIEENEVYLKQSGDTMELARTAVEKLREAVVFMPGVNSSLNHTLSDEYERTAKWVAPELILLETKSDAALTLLSLYEEVLAEYGTADLDYFYHCQTKMAASAALSPEERMQYGETYVRINELQLTRMVIEALLAVDGYFDQLDSKDVSRMLFDFHEYVRIDNASASRYYDDVSSKMLFEMYRSGEYGGTIIIK